MLLIFLTIYTKHVKIARMLSLGTSQVAKPRMVVTLGSEQITSGNRDPWVVRPNKDTPKPRGGVRGVIPGKMGYETEQ
jgi:hypothetical protein